MPYSKKLTDRQIAFIKKKQEEQRLNEQSIKDMETLVDLGGKLNKLQQKRFNEYEKELVTVERLGFVKQETGSLEKRLIKQAQSLNKIKSKAANLAKSQLDVIKKQLDEGRITEDVFKSQAGVINELASGTASVAEVQKAIADLGEDVTQSMREYLDTQLQIAKASELNKGLLEAADDLTGGMVSKAKEFVEAMKENPMLVLLTVATTLLKSFSDSIDKIGEKFGAIGVRDFSQDLMTADAELIRLGYDAGTAGDMANILSTEFGIIFKDAAKLAPQIANMAKALGLSTDEGAKVIGLFQTMSNLSTEGAIQLAKQTEMLAISEGVAPAAVMKDIAGSSEIIAKFTDKGGKNIGIAAIQARKLGTDLSTVAGIMEGLLDFQSSIEAEMEASVLIGRQLNFQRARELALNNDISGAMSEVISQLGSEEEFGRLNLIQRKALAQSIGVGVDELAKFVSNQGKATSLADQLSKQKGFEELVGPEALSQLTQLIGNLKSIAATIIRVVGPPLNFLVSVFANIAKGVSMATNFLTEHKAVALSLAAVLGVMGRKMLANAILSAWSGATKMFSMAPPFGAIAGIALAGGMIASIYQALSKAKSVQLAEGGIAKATPGGISAIIGEGGQDELVTPLNKVGNLVEVDTTPIANEVAGMQSKINETNNRIDRLITNMEGYFGFGGTANKAIGKETTSAIRLAQGI